MLPFIMLPLFLLAAEARALEIPCAPVEKNVIRLDGILHDWDGADGIAVDAPQQVRRGRENWSGPRDLSFELFCNHDSKTLYLAVNVKDEYFIRTREVKGDDHLEIRLGGRLLMVYPGDLRGIKGKLKWKGRRIKGVRMAEALQTSGYSVELALPLRGIPGYKKGAPFFAGDLAVADSDSKSQGKIQTVMGTPTRRQGGKFVFGLAAAMLDSFLEALKYSQDQITRRISANVAGDSRPEQVVLAGRTIGVVGGGLGQGTFFYQHLPVEGPRDVHWLKLMDLNGDRRMEVVAYCLERGTTGQRELILVYRFNAANKFVKALAVEVLKRQDGREITNRFTFKKRGKRGVDLLVDRPRSKGFSASNYNDSPATDALPILLPWEKEKKRRVRFEGEEFTQ